MAVTRFSIERINGAPNVPAEITADDRQFTKLFKVLVDSDQDEGQVIYGYALCPKIGDAYTYGLITDPSSRVVGVNIKPMGGRYTDTDLNNPSGEWAWSVEVRYSRKGETVENPLDRPAKVYYDGEQYDAPFERDLDGRAVLNSARGPFDPPALRAENNHTIRIEKNLPAFNNAVAEMFENSLNSTTFLGYEPDTLRILKVTASPQEDATFGSYYATSTEILRKPIEYSGHEPHQAYILDMGRYEIDRQPILDRESQPVTDPVLLNGVGRELPSGGTPVYLKYRRYPRRDFNSFGIYP